MIKIVGLAHMMKQLLIRQASTDLVVPLTVDVVKSIRWVHVLRFKDVASEVCCLKGFNYSLYIIGSSYPFLKFFFLII